MQCEDGWNVGVTDRLMREVERAEGHVVAQPLKSCSKDEEAACLSALRRAGEWTERCGRFETLLSTEEAAEWLLDLFSEGQILFAVSGTKQQVMRRLEEARDMFRMQADFLREGEEQDVVSDIMRNIRDAALQISSQNEKNVPPASTISVCRQIRHSPSIRLPEWISRCFRSIRFEILMRTQ